MEPSLILGLILGVVSALVALPFLIRLWPKQGQWGINTKPVGCPECGEAFPRIRKPANKRQAMWGGWTCAKCGTECDKYGKKIDANSPTG